MNALDLACALLSSVAYRTGVDDANRIPPIADATRLPGELGYKTIGGISGFEASAFDYQGKIVIAFAGTNTDQKADLIANLVLGLGFNHIQLLQAAEFYLSIKNNPAYAGKEIVFTGHSLGGGLAAAMGVFFNKQAVTFDPAPFRLAVTNANADAIKTYLASNHPDWLQDSDLASYTTVEGIVGRSVPTISAALAAALLPISPALSLKVATMAYPITIRGEVNVKAYSVSGEFLTNGYQGLLSADLNALRIQSSSQPESIVINPAGAALGQFDLHSITLLVAAAKDPRLATLFNQYPRLTEALFDKTLYAHDGSDKQTDFLARLVQQEFGGPNSIDGTGYLGKFADDLTKLLAKLDGMTGQPAIQKALVVAAMEYYYFKDAKSATAFFTTDGNGIQFKYSDIGAPSYKSLTLLAQAVQPYLGTGENQLAGTAQLLKQDAWHIQSGTNGLNWIAADSSADVAIGGAGVDIMDAGAGNDILVGGAGRDFLTGGTGDDRLLGGLDVDTYVFAAQWGKDIVADLDGQGLIQIDGQTLGEAKAAGKRDVWTAKLGDGQFVGLAVYDSSFSTGKKLVITRAGSTADTITINNFDPAAARGTNGYLGTKLADDVQLLVSGSDNAALAQGNPFQAWDFDPNIFVGDSAIGEGGGKSFTVYLNLAAKAGETLELALAGVASDGIKAVLGDETVTANGAVITLAEGQTQVTFALIQDGGIDADAAGSLSVSYHGAAGQTATSNTWGLNLQNRENPTNAITGDDPAHESTRDNLTGTAAADLMQGLTNDDALLGLAGDDNIEGDAGSDVLMAGLGADTLDGGTGNDILLGSSNGTFTNAKSLPDGATVIGQGLTWTYYTSGADADGYSKGFLTGLERDLQAGDAGNVIEGGAGNDVIFAGTGDDLVHGGEDNDDIEGMGDADVLLGDAGDDRIYGDGENIADYATYTPPEQHGADFIDGGDGDDIVIGQGGNDDVYGGAGNDKMWGDDRDPVNTPPAIHGNDYLDGEEGNDTIIGGGRDDVLYGGADNDELWGDDSYIGNTPHELNGQDYLDGEDGDDQLFGGGNNDVLYGGTGNDVLYGDDPLNDRTPESFHGEDYLDGEDGNDSLVGGGRADTLYGGSGNDVLYGDGGGHAQGEVGYIDPASHGDDYLDGEDGDDILIGEGGKDQLFGGLGNDLLAGDALDASLPAEANADDYLDGEDGDDTLYGGGGNDVLFGGTGNDQLSGGAPSFVADSDGDDYLDGEDGNDVLAGGSGNDALIGGTGNDELQGGAGNDQLDGGGDNDHLFGEAGDDTMAGGEGDDQLTGGDGNDSLYAGAGNDSLVGGAGDDALYGEAGNDQLQGGEGNDVLSGDEGDDLLYGDAGDDILDAGSGNNQLQGGEGNDQLFGGEGNDSLFGGAGDDTLVGGGDDDQLQGGEGNDQLLGGEGNDSLFGGAGDDTLVGGSGNDQLQGGEGNDMVLGGEASSALFGDSGNDTLSGGSNSDYLDGGNGNDLLTSGGGNDVLVASAGDDRLEGGDGDDRYVITAGAGHVTIADASGTTSIVFGEALGQAAIVGGSVADGTQVMTFASGEIVEVNGSVSRYEFATGAVLTSDQMAALIEQANQGPLQPPAPAERITGTAGNDTLMGGSVTDYIIAGAGADSVDGGAGDDALFGDAGNDTLRGGTGSDALAGGDGNDLLYGEAGTDRLWGLAGDDFLYGGDGDDELTGGDGTDLLVGGHGDDLLAAGGTGIKTYSFALDDGSDVLASYTGTRHVEFGAGIAPTDIKMFFSATYVAQPYVRVQYSANDSLLIQLGAGTGPLDYRFANGTVMTQASLAAIAKQSSQPSKVVFGTSGGDYLYANGVAALLEGGAGDDRLWGSDYADVLNGGSGNDSIYGAGGSDILQGSIGDDSLQGNGGGDTYLYARGDGSDVITEDGNQADVNVLRFADLSTADVVYTRESSGSLLIHIKNSADTIEISGWYGDTPTRIQQIAYADGSVLDTSAFDNLLQSQIVGSSGADSLTGTALADIVDAGAGDDTIDGSGGNDSIAGGAGTDTYLVYRGMGLDTIRETAGGLSILKLATGLTFEQLVIVRQNDDLYLHFTEANDGVLLKDYFNGISNWAVLNDAGEQKTIAQVIADNGNQPSPLTVVQLREAWLIQAKTALLQSYAEDAAYSSRAYWYTSPYSLTIDHPGYSRATFGFSEAVSSSDAGYFERASDYTSSSDGGSITETRTVSYPVARYTPVVESGNVVVMDYGDLGNTGLPNRITFDWTNTSFAYSVSYVTVTGTVEVPIRGYSEVIEHIVGGPSANVINTWGMGTVDAGDGDDLIYHSWQASYPPGQFLYGGAGNDVIFGFRNNDMLVGGDGDDYLGGGQGNDSYYLMAGEMGTKIIDEVATAWFMPQLPNGRPVWNDGGRYSTDTVEFGAGIDLAHLSVRRGQYASSIDVDYRGTPDARIYDTLDFSWGEGQMARVLLADATQWISPYNDGYGIECFKFADGSVFTLAEMEALAGSANHTPTVQRPIEAQETGEDAVWTFTVPANSFVDADAADTLTYSATRADGEALPRWLSFDASTRTFSGTPLNADVGSLTLKVTATDPQGLSASSEFALTVSNVNDAPIAAQTIGNQAATQGQLWSFVVPAGIFVDADRNDTLTFSARLANGDALPGWLGFNAVTQTFSGTPANADVGGLSLRLTATDAAGATAGVNFDLSVANVNDAPIVNAIATDQNAVESRPFNVQLHANLFLDIDADDSLTWSVRLENGLPLPDWLSFDPSTRTLSGTPRLGDAGATMLRVTVFDRAGESSSQSFNLKVSHAPTLAQPVSAQTAMEDERWSFTVPADTFIDADAGDALTYSATLEDGSILPSWLGFDGQIRTFEGIPLNSDVGSLTLKVTATDLAGASASTKFALNIVNVNDAPTVAQALVDQSAVEDEAWSFTVPAGIFADVDAGDDLTYSVAMADGAGLPPWLRFDAATRNFSGTPANGDVGSLSLKVSAADATGARTEAAFTVTVVNVNDAPSAVGSLAAWSVIAGDAVTYTTPLAAFADIDAGDVLAYSATLTDGAALPSWLSFNASTRTFGGTPTINDAGDSILTVTATDVGGLATYQTINLHVATGLTLYGTSGVDTLTGRAGNDFLDGLAGADQMRGGKGDDTYVVDSIGDTVTELPSEGIDLVYSAITYTLPANVEKLTLIGDLLGVPGSGLPPGVTLPTLPEKASAPGTNGTGNASDNVLVGNTQINILTAGAGNDTLDGGAGDDRLVGGTGNDMYILGRGYGKDTIAEDDTTLGNSDMALFTADVASDQLWFRKRGNNLEVTIIGTQDGFVISDWYKGDRYRVEQFKTSDGKTLLDSQVQNLVDAMAKFNPPRAGETTLAPDYQSALGGVIAANWQ
jgi:Ca2+-binding RTX toxin-like protein